MRAEFLNSIKSNCDTYLQDCKPAETPPTEVQNAPEANPVPEVTGTVDVAVQPEPTPAATTGTSNSLSPETLAKLQRMAGINY